MMGKLIKVPKGKLVERVVYEEPKKQFDINADADHIIRLGVGRPPHAECSCGWKTKGMEDLIELGKLAFDHRDATGHQLRKPTNPL